MKKISFNLILLFYIYAKNKIKGHFKSKIN